MQNSIDHDVEDGTFQQLAVGYYFQSALEDERAANWTQLVLHGTYNSRGNGLHFVLILAEITITSRQ